MPKINVGSLDLSLRDLLWLRALCKVKGEATRSRLSQVWSGYIKRFSRMLVREVDVVARVNEVTWEEAFLLLVHKEPVDTTECRFDPEDIEWAKQQSPVLIREEEIQSLYELPVACEEEKGDRS